MHIDMSLNLSLSLSNHIILYIYIHISFLKIRPTTRCVAVAQADVQEMQKQYPISDDPIMNPSIDDFPDNQAGPLPLMFALQIE